MANLTIKVLNSLPTTLEQGVIYITKDDLTGFLNISLYDPVTETIRKNIGSNEIESIINEYILNKANVDHQHEISDIHNLQDALNARQPIGNYISPTELNDSIANKQVKLISGDNIKTLNNESLLGSGNFSFKTINGESITGSGNISVNLDNVTVTSVAGRVGDVVLTKADVGLNNVDNTSDVNKPVSTSQQEALDTKLSLTGGVLEGPIILNADATEPLEAVTLQQLINAINSFSPVDNNGDTLLKKQGGVMTGSLILNADATEPLEAVTLQQLTSTSDLDRNRSNHTGTQSISTINGLEEALNNKQDKLISGENIRTITNKSIIGQGNIIINHSDLSGLEEDTHTNYLNITRGDARYQQISLLPSAIKDFLIAGNNIVIVDNGNTLTISAAVTAAVSSVNGYVGDVTLNYNDVGADPSGTAETLLEAHENDEDPHSVYLKTTDIIAGENVTIIRDDINHTVTIGASVIADVNSVNGKTGDVVITAEDIGADIAGTAALLIATHNAEEDPHTNYLNKTRADSAYAKIDHQHISSEITDLQEYIEDTIASTIVPGNAVSVAYDDTLGKITIGSTSNPGSGNDYVVFERNGSVAGQTHSFKLKETQNTYNKDAYALKEVPAALNQIKTLDNFDSYSSENHIVTEDLIFDGTLKPYTGETSNLEFKTTHYEKEIRSNGEYITIIANESSYIIPKFTSSAPVNGVSVSSSSYLSSYYPWLALNDTLGTNNCWFSNAVPTTQSPEWIKISFPELTPINGYFIHNRNYSTASGAKTWILQGSNDGSNWSDIHSVVNDTNNTPNAIRKFYLNTEVSYIHYRLYITDVNANTGYVSIQEFDFFKTSGFNILGNDNEYYTLNNGSLVQLNTPFEQSFNNSGVITSSELSDILPIKLISQEQSSYTLFYKAKPQIAITKKLIDASMWSSINSMTLTATSTGNTVLRCAVVSPNLISFMVYKNSTWVDIGSLTNDLISANTLLSQGMSMSELNAIPKAAWATLFSSSESGTPENLGFAFAFSPPESSAETVFINTLSTNVDIKSYFKKASTGEIEISWFDSSVVFKTLTAGNYKMAFQVSSDLVSDYVDPSLDYSYIPQDLVDGYYIGFNQ